MKKSELIEIKNIISEGKYDGAVVDPLLDILVKTYDDRLKSREYIMRNQLTNTTPGRAFETAEKHFEKAFYFYTRAKKLLDKLK